MKAARIEKPNHAVVTTVDEPSLGANEVLIKVHSAGICGTDLHIFKGEYEAEYPIIPGHEFSGEVVAVGTNVTNFNLGDRVTADPNIPVTGVRIANAMNPTNAKTYWRLG